MQGSEYYTSREYGDFWLWGAVIEGGHKKEVSGVPGNIL